MTIEEAAKILDPKTSRNALLKYKEGEQRLDACNEACRLAASALRAQQTPLDRSRWEGCHECKPTSCGTCVRYYHRNTGDPCTTACIRYSKHKPVNFCKNCGRPLTEGAWAELERRINGGTTD